MGERNNWLCGWWERRKKGLKNPFILWCVSFLITFALTILPSMLLLVFTEEDHTVLFNREEWSKTIIANLYTMIITQSVVTALQNRGAADPIKEKQKTRQYTIRTSWTTALMVCVPLYIFGYIFFYCSSFPWRDLALYAISGLIAAIGLASVLQLENEQEKIRQAIKQEAQKGQGSPEARAQAFGLDLGNGWQDAAAPPGDNRAREGSLPKDGASV